MKKLLIVCEEKYKVFADYLAQLISLEDDTEEKSVGVTDGEVSAQVWLENDYKSNSAQIASNQYIVFIGQNKLIKEKSSHMKVVFSQYGINYGWLGKQAVVTVNKAIQIEDYDEFLHYALNYQNDLEKLTEKKDAKEENKIKVAGNDEKRALTLVKQAAAIAPQIGSNFLRKRAYNKKIEQQQYSFAIMKFYIDYLAEFLGM